jgi:hypothetical protein
LDFAKYFCKFFKRQWTSNMPSDYKGPSLQFFIAWFNDSEVYGRVYQINIPPKRDPKEEIADYFGITWGGKKNI